MKTHKNAWTLVILAAVLALALAGYFGLRAWNDRTAARESSPAATLADLTDISAITYTAPDGEALIFTKADGVWRYEPDPSFPLDDSYLVSIAQTLQPLEAIRVFDAPDALDAYGLTEGAKSVTATSDGASFTILLGNSYGEEVYAKTPEGETVYAISNALSQAIDHTLLELVKLPVLPTAAEADLETITVTTSAGETVYQKSTQTDEDDVETYTWTKNGEAVVEDDQTLSDLLSAVSAPSFTACYDYKGDADTRAACGLNEGTTVTVDTKEAGYTLTLGRQTDIGVGYYAALEGEAGIYTLAAALTEPLMAAAE